jgi:hypothetical protein
MIGKRYKCLVLFLAILLLMTVGNTAQVENQKDTPRSVHLEIMPASSTVLYPMRQETIDSFERAVLDPWTTSGYNWGIRDTTDQYGPDSCALSGYRYAGVPQTDIPFYSGNQTGYLISPTFNTTGWTAFYLSFNYWSSFEGPATNFDGGIVEISPNNGTTWIQVDSLAQGHLDPTYDEPLAGTGSLLYDWAYCYSTDPDWVSVSSLDLMGLGYVAAGNQVSVRFTFASDPLSAGQGWFIDDVRIADTPPPDEQPPLVAHTPLPDTPDTLSNYTVTARITDAGSGVDPDSVILHYEIENGPILDVPMTSVGTDTFEADIPAQGYHTDIWYRIEAADYVGNWAQTRLYNFEVTNARTIIYDDGQPYITSAVVNVGDGAFAKFAFSDVGIDSGLVHQVKLYLDNPGQYDIRVYEATGTLPGPFIDSMAGFTSSGYAWQTADITDLNIQLSGEVVVGYIIHTDSLGCLRDQNLEYPTRMFTYINNAWGYSSGGGDHMIRLKVIPITFTGIEENTEQPANYFSLSQVSPNPTRKDAIIEYQVPTGQRISLRIYDTSGQLVKTLVDQHTAPGTYRVLWDRRDEQGRAVANGVYFYRLQGMTQSATKKLIVVR